MSQATVNKGWTKDLTRYHWFVLGVAALGWMFDCLDQQLFNLARAPAMKELLANSPGSDPTEYGGYATAIFLIGWATGGLTFGVLGDRIGRAKTMMLTILMYSACTGLSALSVGFWDFSFYRFLTGLGVGGEFAVGVALVAEVMPDRARPFALGWLQALSAVGNITAAFISIGLGRLEEQGILGKFELFGTTMTAWRLMFIVGALPALLAVVIRRGLKEPERWQQMKHEDATKKAVGSYAALFGNPMLRKRALVGMVLAAAGVIGLWGIGFFSIDFNRSVFRNYYVNVARENGAAAADQTFVKMAIEDPAKAKELVKFLPADLISPDGASRAAREDASTLYQAAMALHDKGESVSNNSVLAYLDTADPEQDRKAESPEDRARREAYLSGGAVNVADMKAEIDRIQTRTSEISGNLIRWGGITSLMFNIGAFFGIYAFSRITARIGRKPAFALAFTSAMITTACVFIFMSYRHITMWDQAVFTDVFWMIPIMGFCQLSIFGGYAIYFPELFPTRLRSTGTSFCYNVGRFVAATGPWTLGSLAGGLFRESAEPLRWSGVCMCSIFLVGLLALPFAPETRGQPLPE